MPSVSTASSVHAVSRFSAPTAADPVPLIRPDQFRAAIAQGDVVVEFMNFGCPYCRGAAPELDKVARQKMGKVKFFKMSLRDPMAQALAGQYGATLLPSFAVFRNGSFVGTFSRQGREIPDAKFITANVNYAFSS